MNPTRSIAVALALSSLIALGGCQTAGTTKTADNRIRVNSGSYEGDGTSLGGDIKSILMAGGLDVANPMAPTQDTTRSEIAKARPAAIDTEAMVAALSESTTRTSSAAQTLKPQTVEPRSASSSPAVALALVEEPAPAPRRKTVLETRIEKEPIQTIELASINMSSDEAFAPLPEPVATLTAATAEPVAKKTVRPPASKPAVEVAKTSRVRRF